MLRADFFGTLWFAFGIDVVYDWGEENGLVRRRGEPAFFLVLFCGSLNSFRFRWRFTGGFSDIFPVFFSIPRPVSRRAPIRTCRYEGRACGRRLASRIRRGRRLVPRCLLFHGPTGGVQRCPRFSHRGYCARWLHISYSSLILGCLVSR